MVISKHRMSAKQRKAAIVDAAVDLFSQRGFQGTTTRELAAKVGVSEPVLYQHFSTKRALYNAILEAKMGEDRSCALAQLEAVAKEGNIREFFSQLAGLLLDWYLDDPRYARMLMFSRLEENEMSHLFYESHVSVFYEFLTRCLKHRMDCGALRKMNPLLAARAFAGMVVHQGMVFAIYKPGDLPAKRPEMIRTIVDIFLNGVLVNENS